MPSVAVSDFRFDSKEVTLGGKLAKAGQQSTGSNEVFRGDHEGKQVIAQSRLEPSDLDEYIGKEPADNLRREIASKEYDRSQWGVEHDPDNDEWYVTDPNGEPWEGLVFANKAEAEQGIADYLQHAGEEYGAARISGLDLKVGGEGMRHFYDRLLPKRLEKILKPFGGTVERSGLRVPFTTEGEGPGLRQIGESFFDTLAEAGTIQGRVPVGDNQTLMSRPELVAAFESQALTPFHFSPSVQQRVTRRGVTEPAWIARLTPEMKERIRREGLPLLSLLGAGYLWQAPNEQPEYRQ